MYLCTVPGTGSRYFRRQIPGNGIAHCSEVSVGEAKKYDIVATTYRDPVRTAATWANNHRSWALWDHFWYWYEELIKLPTVKIFDFSVGEGYQHGYYFDGIPRGKSPDKYGLHAALDRGDHHYFYRYVPKGLKWLSD